LDGAKNKSILRWYALEEDQTILQNSWFPGCDGNLAYLERENYAWRIHRKEVYQPILKELEEYGVVLKNRA
jgi:hypothetical protein